MYKYTKNYTYNSPRITLLYLLLRFFFISGSPKPKRGSTSPLIEYKGDSLGVTRKLNTNESVSNSLSPFFGCNGSSKPISSIKDLEAESSIISRRKESFISNNSSNHENHGDVFEPVPDEEKIL